MSNGLISRVLALNEMNGKQTNKQKNVRKQCVCVRVGFMAITAKICGHKIIHSTHINLQRHMLFAVGDTL